MRLHQSPSRPTSTTLILAAFLLTSGVVAQGLPKLPGTTTDGGSQTSAAAGSSTSGTTGSSAAASAAATSSGGTSSTKPSGTTSSKPSSTSSGSSSSSGLPALSTTSDAPGLTGLPKLAGDNYPPPSVPPTANAPCMQHSTLPQGTVFIAVGAALGFIGMLVIAWRGLVAWSIHRSVRNAALAHSAKFAHGRDPRATPATKSAYLAPSAASNMTLDPLAASGKSKTNRSSRVPSAHTSLFFSPTAGTGTQGNPNRTSSYLPAGYYAAGAQSPSGMTHVGSGVPMANLTNIRDSKHYSRNNSPPGTPPLRPSSLIGGPESPHGARLSTSALVGGGHSSSTINLNAPTQGRAPSAYLEDLFENHPPIGASSGGAGNLTHDENPRASKRYSRY